MSQIRKYAFYLIFISLFACQNRSESLLAIKNYRSNFRQSITEWQSGYSNLSSGVTSTDTTFTITRTPLPTGLDTTVFSLEWKSYNLNSNAISYIKSEIKGLNPKHTYQVNFQLKLASAYPESSDAGKKVHLKVGALTFEPLSNPLTGQINFDKGSPSQDGKDLNVLGNIAKESNRSGFGIIERNNSTHPFTVQANDDGKIWLCIATDSEYVGTSQIYIESINVILSER
jgi:hypothetical protein